MVASNMVMFHIRLSGVANYNINEFIIGYVTYCVGRGVAWYVVTIASSAESLYMYCVAFIHIHSRHTSVSAPSRLNNQSVRAVSFSY